MANIIGTKGNDTLVGGDSTDTINGKAGNDIITYSYGNDTLTGGGGKDKFVYNYSYYNSTDTITDFGGVGKGTNPTAAVIAEVDTIKFQGAGLTAENLLLTQNGSNLEITFEGEVGFSPTVILQNFKLENLNNLSLSTGATVDLGNIEFNGQTKITDSFDVFNANSTQSTIFNLNTVTFLNDLDNNVNGFDNSDDVINGQRGNDKIDGKSGNDILRGGAGNDTLIGGAGNDTLIGDVGNNSLVGGTGNDYLNIEFSTGNNTLNGGIGDDFLNAGYSSGNNLLSGDDGNDSLVVGAFNYYPSIGLFGNNTLNGGAGDDYLSVGSSEGNNLLDGGAGNDSFYVYVVSGFYTSSSDLVTQTVNGGKGDDYLSVDYTNATGGITTTFNATTNIGSITAGTNRVSYKNIEWLTISGTADNDNIVGSNGNDTLSTGYGGNDIIDGGKGDDYLSVYFGNATGGITTLFNATTNIGSITAGTNRVSYKNIERLTISGTADNDNIVGSNGNDTLSTGDGGNDTIDGGKGNDYLSVDYYNAGITSTFNATTNIGSITAGTNRVSYKNIEGLTISGTQYDDNIVGSNGNDTFVGGDGGNDKIDGGRGDDLLSVAYNPYDSNVTKGITTRFDITTNIGSITTGTNRVSYKNIEQLDIRGTQYDDNIVGSNGNDTLSGGDGGNDTIIGGAGNDYLTANDSTSNNLLSGGNGNDYLEAYNTVGNNTLNGGDGNDSLSFIIVPSDLVTQTVDGGTGDDTLSSYYYKTTQRITMTFNATTNIGSITQGTNQVNYKNIERLDIRGTAYDDNIVGSNGNDTLNGGDGGNDILTGGKGNDTFAFYNYNQGVTRLDDFNATNELIQVSAAGFGGGLSIGSLQTSQFRTGTSATTTSQRFIYNNTTGALYFDLDGSAGAFTQVKFAQLSSGVTLTENNFMVV